jgi:hypothetical protein
MQKMHIFSRALATSCLAVAALTTAALAKPKPPEAPDGRVAFEKLKTLVGTWRGHVGTPDRAATIEYRLVSGGTVVMETLFPGTSHEMISMYYLDGGNLLLTHFCSAGNQPQMTYDRKRSTPREFVFKFDGGRGFVAREDLHIHNGWIRFLDENRLEEGWTAWEHGKQSGTHNFVLTRQAR